jgi:hypothetical protein
MKHATQLSAELITAIVVLWSADFHALLWCTFRRLSSHDDFTQRCFTLEGGND